MKSEVLKGLEIMQKRLGELDFIAVPAGPFVREWKNDVRNSAVKNAPNWKGGIIKSIQTAQDSKRFPLWARVYSNEPIARWADLGTGRLSIDPLSPKQPYFPSIEGVRDWAEDHGFEPYVLAEIIQQHGGTPPTRFFQRAVEDANASRNERLAKFGGGIMRQAPILP